MEGERLQSDCEEEGGPGTAEALRAADTADLITLDVDDDDIDDEDEFASASSAPAPAPAPAATTAEVQPLQPQYYRGLGKRLEPFARLAVPMDRRNQNQIQARLDAIEFFRVVNASEMAEAPPLTGKDSGPLFCRICRDTEDMTKEAVVSPCRCRGSVARVHVTCLERWLAESDSSACELCGHQYHTVRTPSYNVLASIPIWMIHTGSTDLLFDFVAFVIVTPVALFGTHLGINSEDSAFFQVSLMAAIDLVFSAWLTMRLHYHAICWYSWWRRKSTVKLILDTELPIHENEM